MFVSTMLRYSVAPLGRHGVSLAAPLAMATRGYADLVHAGRGGRCSIDGKTVTVFGATGQMGRYLVNELGMLFIYI